MARKKLLSKAELEKSVAAGKKQRTKCLSCDVIYYVYDEKGKADPNKITVGICPNCKKLERWRYASDG